MSDSSPATVVERFRARRTLAAAVIGGWALMAAAAAFVGFPEAHAPLLGKVYVGVLLGSMVPLLWKWRCPKCNKYLGGAWSAKFCPGCGVKFTAE